MTRQYDIPEDKVTALVRRCEKLASRARASGLPPPSIKVVDRKSVTKEVRDPLAKVRGHDKDTKSVGIVLAVVEVDGCTPHLNDWRIVGHRYSYRDRAGNVFSADSGDVPDAKHGTPLCCDHCGLKRRRATTLIVNNDQDDRTLEVGADCLNDFLGAEYNSRFLTSLKDLGTLLSEIEAASKWSFDDPGLDLKEEARTVLAVAINIIAEHGFVSSGTAREEHDTPTWRHVAEELARLNNANTDPDTILISAADFMAADNVIKFFEADQSDSSFNDSVKHCIKTGLAATKDIAVLTAAAGIYEKRMKANAEKEKFSGIVEKSRLVGEVDERMTFIGTVRGLRDINSAYGTFTIVEIIDRNNNLIVWKTSSDVKLTEGHRYEFKGCVKAHSEAKYGLFKGANQTEMKRLTVTEKFGEDRDITPSSAEVALDAELDSLGI